MNVRKIAASAAIASLAVNAFAWNEGEIIAHFPFDEDYKSKVNVESNGVDAIFVNGAQIDFNTDVKCKHVHERLGDEPRENKGSLHIKYPSAVTIDMSNFGLGADLKRLTCEFFFKTKGTFANYTMFARLGLGVSNANGSVTWKGAEMFYVQNQGTKLYGVARNQDGVKNGTAVVSLSKAFEKADITDGAWHHAVIVIDGKTSGQFKGWLSVDYAGAGDTTKFTPITTCGWHGLTPESGQKLYLQLGHSSDGKTGEIFIDEMRFFAGINATTALGAASAPYACYWLRQIEDKDVWENIADGTALLYCPYDSAFGTVAFDNWPVQSIGGEKQYCSSNEVWRGAGTEIWTKDRTEKAREGLNTGALTNSSTYIETGMYALKSPNLKTCTIEWFMKGVKDYESFIDEAQTNKWKTLLSSNGGSAPYIFFVQLTNKGAGDLDRRYYVRVDCAKLIEGKVHNQNHYESAAFTIPKTTAFWNDDKWHHFAVTISEPDAKTHAQTLTCYVDYVQFGKPYVTTTYNWDGQRVNDTLRFENGVCVDEFRISKGVLPVGKFLKPRKPGGLSVEVK